MSTSPDASALTAEGTAAYRQHVEAAAAALPTDASGPPTVGVLHDLALDPLLEDGTVDETRSYADLPHAPAADGTIRTGTIQGTHVVELDRALHLYDGHTPRSVAFPVRMLAAAGVDTLLFTAPAGSVNPQFDRGDLMLLTDHVNFQGQNPLVGPNVEEWGPRFPDMTEPYDTDLRRTLGAVSRAEGMSLQKGIFLALLGPNAETTAEHRMAHRLGADAVGNSLVPEVIAARHMDMSVAGIALLTDSHLSDRSPASADGETLSTARTRLRQLLTASLAELHPTTEPTP